MGKTDARRPSEVFTPIHLTPNGEAPHRRAELAREVFGRQILRLDVEPIPGQDLHIDLKLWNLPGLKLISGATGGVVTPRTKSLLSDGNDDVFITFLRSGRMGITHRGEQTLLIDGDSHVVSNGDCAVHTHFGSISRGVLVPRRAIADLVPDLDSRTGRVLSRQTPGLQLLRSHVAAFDESCATPSAEITQTFVRHVHDLVALVLGASRDGHNQIARRGLRAARLDAVKGHIARNLTAGDLSIDAVAASQGLTRRRLQRLFETEGTTFSAFVLQGRLGLAHTMLSDGWLIHTPISDVAYECGFSDISHFNHAFRRAYGATPSDIRMQALIQRSERPPAGRQSPIYPGQSAG
jgi:AraC-like DNA-binding protein